MPSLTRRSAATIGAASAVLIALVGCSGTGSTDDPAASSGSSDGAFPVTITSAFGDTTLDAAPERPAAISYGNADFLLALGVVPVGMAAVSWGDEDGDGYLPWTLDAVDALGGDVDDITLYDEATSTADFEAVSDSAPDLIYGPYSGITEEDYATLNEIAPTISYPKGAWFTPWRENLALAGKALGKEDEAAKVQSDLEQQISDAVDAGGWGGKTFLVYSFDPTDTSQIGFYTVSDTRVEFLSDLGLVVPDSVKTASADAAGAFYTTISAENADLLDDVDMIIGYGNKDTLAQMQADPLISKMRAVENGAVVVLDSGDQGQGTSLAASLTPTPLSIPYVLKNAGPLLADAATKVK